MTGAGHTILFAGGGSGGHISPGLAIAERLRELDPHVRTIFACSQRKIDSTMLQQARAEFAPMPAAPPSLGPRAFIRFVRCFFQTKRLAASLMRERGVTQVVALGGFVAAPVVAAAKNAGIPVTLVNLDAPPGAANRWMARRCDLVLSAVPVPQTPGFPGFARQIVGMPIRRCTLAPADQRQCRLQLGLDPELPTLLVTGASQGARSLNAVMTALAGSDPGLFTGWQVYHLAGEGDDAQIRQAYAGAGIRAIVAPFLHEMGLAWGAADLAVTRAGANSVAEVAANAVPALFLPYPHHRDQHQRHNARPLVEAGGAVMIDDLIDPAANAATVGPALKGLMTDSARRGAMRAAMTANRREDAAATIVKILLARE